ncbi:GNAT family N-acetyltransferase [Neisseria lisongii]|uniref:GNAT family N-acetyltransferase n=1 Tax=Neisseria lisongii TaxID=2912188 RepID=A0AAW5AMI2_9NEIS|nr:bifunctional acetate--CoA ligase family protein/GNAT family N-acetyltransferase [Neisseria lisongii]MCF7529734.1 GNAT family N-acetyltransferase [Neisseria lisongii]
MPQAMPGYFFTPKHIVLVGASERADSLGEQILTSLLGSPFDGTITPVNLRHRFVAGIRAYTSPAHIPEGADLVIAVTPPDSYEALFKACRKKQLHHIILIQDWPTLPEEAWRTARQLIKKYHGEELSISVCNPAGFQLPTQGLNAGIQDDYPAGHVAFLSGDDAVSHEVTQMLRRMKQGLSRHISLNFALTPVSAADWLNRFGHNRHTRVAVIHYNTLENPPKLFSAVRYFARHTPVILYCTHAADKTEKAVLNCLARHNNFLPVFTPEHLESALHTYLAELKPVQQLTVLANTPAAWLQPTAEKYAVRLQLPTRKPRLNQGNLGTYATASAYRSAAVEQLQNPDCQALLAVIAADSEHHETAVSRVLKNLARTSDKPLLISSRFSDGLLHFSHPEQALQALSLANTVAQLQQEQQQTAPPAADNLKTPDPQAVRQAIESSSPSKLVQALHLPKCQNQCRHEAVRLTAFVHPHYGWTVSAVYQGKTAAVLPPFSSLDAQFLAQTADIGEFSQEINQFLHSLSALTETADDFGNISLCFGNGQTVSNIHFKNKAAAKLKTAQRPTAAEIFRSFNINSATEFIRQTGESAAELLSHKPAAPPKSVGIQNVRAPYPTDSGNWQTADGKTVFIRPFRPEDAAAKQQFIRKLPPESRQTRFMAAINELPPATLARFSRLDYHAEGAYIAENSDGIAAVSRFSRLTRDECEFGITVAEKMRGSGLAAEMMRRIILLATQQGYKSMSAEILKSNTAMLKLAEKSGFTLTPSAEDKQLYQAKLRLLPDETADRHNFPQKNLHKNHKLS